MRRTVLVSQTSNVWLNDKITLIKNLRTNDQLFGCNKVEEIFDNSFKRKYVIKLVNGFKIEAYKQQILSIAKNKSRKIDYLTVDDILTDLGSNKRVKYSVKIPKHKNNNLDYTWQKKVLSNKICYQLGLEYINRSYSIFNRKATYDSQLDFIFFNKNRLNLQRFSQLSQAQFFSFLEAIFDHSSTFEVDKIVIKDPNRDDFRLYNLLLWNGLISYFGKSSNEIILYNCKNNAKVLKDKLIQPQEYQQFRQFRDHFLIGIDSIDVENIFIPIKNLQTTNHIINISGIQIYS